MPILRYFKKLLPSYRPNGAKGFWFISTIVIISIFSVMSSSEWFFAVSSTMRGGVKSLPDGFTDAMNMLFFMMRNNYDRDSEAYEKVCEMRSENARKRWEKAE